jgi:hypothetical protein
MPTPAGGFAVVLTQADRLDHDELGEWGALADCDRPIADMPIDELAYRLGSVADGLADYLVRELGGDEFTPDEQALYDELGRTTPLPGEIIRQAVLAEREFGNSARAILSTFAVQGCTLPEETGAND